MATGPVLTNTPTSAAQLMPTLLAPGGAASATQTPDNSNLSAPYQEAPSAYGYTSSEMYLNVITKTNGFGTSAGDAYANGNNGATLFDPQQQMGKKPLWEFMGQAEASDPATLMQMQQQLYDAGMYPASYYSSTNTQPVQTGTADAAFITALHDAALESARSAGSPNEMSIDEVVTAHQNAVDALGGAAKAAKLHLTNPDDVAANAVSEGYKSTGQKLAPSTIAQIQTDAENAAEQTYNQSQGVTTADFSANTNWLDQEIANLNPNLTSNFSSFNNFNAASKVIGQSAGLYHK